MARSLRTFTPNARTLAMRCLNLTSAQSSCCQRNGEAHSAPVAARTTCMRQSDDTVTDKAVVPRRPTVGQTEHRMLPRTAKDAGLALVIGMAFLVVVNGLAGILRPTVAGQFISGLANGLEIIGWVALWQPAELLLSEWVPIYRRLRTTQRVAEAAFECNTAALTAELRAR